MSSEGTDVVGCLVGLAVGDAVGETVEGSAVGAFRPVTLEESMTGGGKYDLLPGQFTDDTSMALCLAESALLGAETPVDVFCRWYRSGHLSPNARCFDIGKQTRGALERHMKGQGAPSVEDGAAEMRGGGNGSIMRLCPVVIRGIATCGQGEVEKVLEAAAESSRSTHPFVEPVDCCRLMAAVLVGVLRGEPKSALLSGPCDRPYCPPGLAQDYWDRRPLCPKVHELATSGRHVTASPPDIANDGSAVGTLRAALWAFHGTSNFADGLLAVVNLGRDADTSGAVYGQISGAYYGLAGIPERWVQNLCWREFIVFLAQQLSLPLPDTERVKALFEVLKVLEEGYHATYAKFSPGPGPPCVWPGGFKTLSDVDAWISDRVLKPFEVSLQGLRGGDADVAAARSLHDGFSKQLCEDRTRMARALERRPQVSNLLSQIRTKALGGSQT